MQQYLRCEQIIMLWFPPVVCPSSTWGSYLYCSHSKHSRDWGSQFEL